MKIKKWVIDSTHSFFDINKIYLEGYCENIRDTREWYNSLFCQYNLLYLSTLIKTR